MLQEDELLLKELFINYPAKLVMKRLAAITLDAASDCSDVGYNDKAKELVQISVAIDDIISGRPFLV
jgi:hypothetical protein